MKLTDGEQRFLEEKLCKAEEKGKEKYEAEQERKIVEKALKKDQKNMAYLNRAFPYLTEQHLIETVRDLYPSLNELFIIDLDQRDGSNIPLIRTKNFRPLKISHTRRSYRGGYIECEVDTQFRMLLAVIEDGTTYIKSATLTNGYYNRKF